LTADPPWVAQDDERVLKELNWSEDCLDFNQEKAQAEVTGAPQEDVCSIVIWHTKTSSR